MNRLLFVLACSASVGAIAGAHAQEAAPSPDAARPPAAEEIVVTATRSPQPIYKVGESITVLTEDIIRQNQTVVVSDLLMQTPGVSFSRNGGVGGVTSLRIRGAETDQTVVVIDGVKLNDPASTGGGYNFADLLSGDIQRIEILRGAQSTLWGSQAIGGVVNIITTEPTRPFEATGEGEGGSRDTVYARAGAGGADGHLTWRLAGSTYTTAGISAYDRGTERDGYHNTGFSGRLRYDFTDDFGVDLRGFYQRGRNGFDGFPPPNFAFADTREYGFTKEFIGYAGANFNVLDGRIKNRVAYTYTDTVRELVNIDQPVTIETFASNGHNRRLEYQGSAGLAAGWDAVFGAEHEHSDFRSASPSQFTPNPVPATASATINSGYVQLHGDVVTDLSLTGGIRYDDHNTYGGRALGQFAGAWSLNDGATVLRASFGQGFKAPTLYQLRSIYGNLGLKPEHANSWDGGVEQKFLDGAIEVSATGFYRKTTNQIDFVSCPSASPLCTQASFGIYDNIARTHADGVELAGAAKAGALSLQANYTYTDAVNEAPGANYGKKLPRRPTNAANATLSYAWPQDVSTSVAVRYAGDNFDTISNTFALHSYTLVDLRASWQVLKSLEIYGRIENLFGETYETTRNYGSPGRGIFAGVRAHF